MINQAIPKPLGKTALAGISVAVAAIPTVASAADFPEFGVVNTAGVMCTNLAQDTTVTWSTPSNGVFLVFDDAKDGKELCYVSFSGKPETATITVTGADGMTLPGSGFIDIDVTPTYNTDSATGCAVYPIVYNDFQASYDFIECCISNYSANGGRLTDPACNILD